MFSVTDGGTTVLCQLSFTVTVDLTYIQTAQVGIGVRVKIIG